MAFVGAVSQRYTQFLHVIDLAWLFAIATATASALYVILWLLKRAAPQAALLATVTFLGLALYGYAFKLLATSGGLRLPYVRHALLLSAGMLLLVLIWRSRGSLRLPSLWLSLTMAVLFIQVTAKLAVWAFNASHAPSHVLTADVPLQSDFKTAMPSVDRPDIYYIILDGYARGDVLARNYAFDNSPFLDGLRRRGFYVADKSCANYPVTILSLSSSLNVNYHQPMPNPFTHQTFFEMVQSPLVGRFLQQHGYQFVHLSNNWPGACRSQIADITLGIERGHRDLRLRFQEPGIAKFLTNQNVRAEHLSILRYGFAKLPEAALTDGPTFTFAHFIAPHPPYVLDRHGRDRQDADPGTRQPYIDELIGLNAEVTRIIDTIRQHSRVPPIIVIQSDHGPGFVADEMGNDHEWVQERLPILNAYLVPENIRKKLYRTITPVNTFRLLLSECCGADLPLLPDRMFITHYRNLSVVREVTDQVHDGQPASSILPPRAGEVPMDHLAGKTPSGS